jgi:hypothetical protein
MKTCGSISSKGKKFSLLKIVQSSSGDHLASYYIDTWESFSVSKAAKA